MRPIFRVALAASCLIASTAVEAQRNSAPAYRPAPAPPPAPRYTPPPPAANQNYRSGSQSGGSGYRGGQTQSGVTGSNRGGYQPGSIANSNSQSSGKAGGVGATSQLGGGTKKSAGIGTTKQAGAAGSGKASKPANDKGKVAGKSAPKAAAAGAGAGLFGAQKASAAPSKSSVDDPFRPDLKGKSKDDFNTAAGGQKSANKSANDNKKKGPGDCPPGQVWDPSLPGCVPKPPTPHPKT